MPGIVVALTLGVLCIVSALIWSMADIWPTPDGGITVSQDALMDAIINTAIAMGIAAIGVLLALKFLPQSPLFKRFVSEGSVKGISNSGSSGLPAGQASGKPDIGAIGTVTKDLRPLGQIEIDGQLYQARCQHGGIPRGRRVRVTEHQSFSILGVEPV